MPVERIDSMLLLPRDIDVYVHVNTEGAGLVACVFSDKYFVKTGSNKKHAYLFDDPDEMNTFASELRVIERLALKAQKKWKVERVWKWDAFEAKVEEFCEKWTNSNLPGSVMDFHRFISNGLPGIDIHGE